MEADLAADSVAAVLGEEPDVAVVIVLATIVLLCTVQFVTHVTLIAKFRLNQTDANQFTAAIVSVKKKVADNQTHVLEETIATTAMTETIVLIATTPTKNLFSEVLHAKTTTWF